MNRYDRLYELYEAFDTGTLRQYQRFADVFPPVDSRVALEQWEAVTEELERRKAKITNTTPDDGAWAEIVARVSREQAFTALDLHATYGRPVNVLVLDVDETLRSAGSTDNEIPRATLALLSSFHENEVPIVICTGQTLENVKGFAIQGLGSALVHSGSVSIVYEGGTGVFTPGHGAATKRLLYDDLDEEVIAVFETLRARALSTATDTVSRGCHLQGNEFNVTIKPNYPTGSDRARDLIERALVHLIDLVGEIVAGEPTGSRWARATYAADPDIAAVLDRNELRVDPENVSIPEQAAQTFERIDVAYYEADAAEVASLELNKVAGVKTAFEILEVTDPFAAVLGDSKTDLRVMEWLTAQNAGVAAAPSHAAEAVLEHVRGTDDLVFEPGRSADMLRIIEALNRLDGMTT